MSDEPPQLSPNEMLERDLIELREWFEQGDIWIKSHYLEDHDPPVEGGELELPPHQIIMERGAGLISFAATIMFQILRPTPQYESEQLLYGVGMELILKGCHLKIDSDGFIDYMERRSGKEGHPARTPRFSDSMNIVLSDLEDDLSEELHSRAGLILNLIKEKRNNEAHLRFMSKREPYFKRVVLQMTQFLINRYAEYEPESLEDFDDEIYNLNLMDVGQTHEIQFNPESSF